MRQRAARDFASSGRERSHGDYLLPYHNGLIRLEKPPLPYWLVVLAHQALGDDRSMHVSELEA